MCAVDFLPTIAEVLSRALPLRKILYNHVVFPKKYALLKSHFALFP